jgi:lipopolysaccharide biosynthesis regulator YciM
MSKHFVSIKINTEKGEGPKLKKKYGVGGLPTLLLVDSKGEEVDRLVGFRPPDKFIAALKPIIAGDSFAALKKRAEAKPDDIKSVLAYAKKLEERRKSAEAEKIYLRIIESKKTDAALRVEAKGRLAILKFVKSRGANAEPLELFFKENKSSKSAVEAARMLFSVYQRQKKNERAVELGEYLLKNGSGEDALFLNSFAWFLATNDLQLKRALKLARKAAKLSPKAPHILDTLAEAYHRNGKHGKAVKTQKKAIELVSERQKKQYEKRLAEFEAALEKSKSGEKE